MPNGFDTLKLAARVAEHQYLHPLTKFDRLCCESIESTVELIECFHMNMRHTVMACEYFDLAVNALITGSPEFVSDS